MTAWVTVLVFGATAYNQTFVRATEMYGEGDYAKAIELYGQLVDEGVVHSAVFYNLGNAYYRSGRLGFAIANYERVLQLDPGNANAHQNLAQCVAQTQGRLARPQPPAWERYLFFWHAGLGPNMTRPAAFLAWVGLWTVLAVRSWRPIRYLRRAAVLLAIAALALGASTWVKARPSRMAVAVEDVVPVHYGIGEQETVRFNLHEGDRVIIDRNDGEWARVAVADGDRGWAKLDHLVPVGPPYLSATAQNRPGARPPEHAGKEAPQ